MYYNLKIKVKDGDEAYPNVQDFIKYFMMTYRDSIGDISEP